MLRYPHYGMMASRASAHCPIQEPLQSVRNPQHEAQTLPTITFPHEYDGGSGLVLSQERGRRDAFSGGRSKGNALCPDVSMGLVERMFGREGWAGPAVGMRHSIKS